MARLWNGEYFCASRPKAHPHGATADGCLSDHLARPVFRYQLGSATLTPARGRAHALQSIWKFTLGAGLRAAARLHTPERFFVHDGKRSFTCTCPKSQPSAKELGALPRRGEWDRIEYHGGGWGLAHRCARVCPPNGGDRCAHPQRYDGSSTYPVQRSRVRRPTTPRGAGDLSCSAGDLGFRVRSDRLGGSASRRRSLPRRPLLSLRQRRLCTFAAARAASISSIRSACAPVGHRPVACTWNPEGIALTACRLVLHDPGEPIQRAGAVRPVRRADRSASTRELVLSPGRMALGRAEHDQARCDLRFRR